MMQPFPQPKFRHIPVRLGSLLARMGTQAISPTDMNSMHAPYDNFPSLVMSEVWCLRRLGELKCHLGDLACSFLPTKGG